MTGLDRPEARASTSFLFGLAPGGVCRAASVAGNAVRSYRTVSPLPRLNATRRGGLFSVALSLGGSIPPPDVIRHRLSMEPGLSSPATFRFWRGAAVRPTDEIGMGITRRAVKPCRATSLRKTHVNVSASTQWCGSCLDECAQSQERRRVGDAINTRLSKMPLERRNNFARSVVIAAGFRNAVAV